MHWIHLTSEDQLNQLIVRSEEKAQVIFKHSTRCSVSSLALKRVQKDCCPENADFYFLDLLAYRTLRIRLLTYSACITNHPRYWLSVKVNVFTKESHLAISMDDIREEIAA